MSSKEFPHKTVLPLLGVLIAAGHGPDGVVEAGALAQLGAELGALAGCGGQAHAHFPLLGGWPERG